MSRDQRAIQFVENLARTLLKEEDGLVLSQKDQKRLFKETVSSLAQGKLQRELRKYSPLYCKRFHRCVRRLRQRLGATAQNLEVTPEIPIDQQCSDIEDEQIEHTERCLPSVSAQPKVRPCPSQDTNNSVTDRNERVNQVCSLDKPSSVSVYSQRLDHSSRQQLGLTRRKDTSCLGRSRNVNELRRELTMLYHHCDPASLIIKMEHAVGLFYSEVADIVISKEINRASDVASCLHSVMLYFHFKCDILHTDKNQVSSCPDAVYKQHVASMLSLYCSLNILITRTELERRNRMARHTLFKACLLLDNGPELMMDVVLQLSVKPEPTDAPFLYPTLMYVLKHPPYPFTPSTYIKHVLVCRLARSVLPPNQYPDLSEQLQSSLTLLPPSNLSTWLTDHCPHLTSEISAYVKGHQMTSYLLQVASYDLCHELQKSLYSQPDSYSLYGGRESSGTADGDAPKTNFSAAVERDTTDIEEHHVVHVVSVMGNHHSKESKIHGNHQDGSTESRKLAEHSVKEISKDIKDYIHAEISISAGEPTQESTTSCASGVSKKTKRISRKKLSSSKALPFASKTHEVECEEDVLVVAKESKSNEKQLKCLASSSGKDESSGKQQGMLQSQMSLSLNKKEKETMDNNHPSVRRKNREFVVKNGNDSLLKQREKDSQEVQVHRTSLNLNMNEKRPNSNCPRSLTCKNRESLERNKPVEECDTVPDSCDDETGSVDIIYSSETEHSDHLQQKMALRKARHLRSLLPSTESSKPGIVSNSSRVMTRSRYKERLSDVNTEQVLKEEGKIDQGNMGKDAEQFQAGSPILKDCMAIEGIPVRLVHVDRNRGGSVGTPEEFETDCEGEEDLSVFMKHASQIRRSLNKLDAFKCDSKNNSPKKLDVASKEISRKQLPSEKLVDCQKSVIPSDFACSGLSASTSIVSNLRRSPRKSNHKIMLDDVAMKELPADKQKSPVFHSADRKPRADSKQVTNLRRSPRKRNLKDKLKSITNEQVTAQSGGDPYELIVSSDSTGDDSKTSSRVASRRSLRGCLKDKSLSPAEHKSPPGSSSCREKVTQQNTTLKTGHQSFKRSADIVQKKRGVTNEKEQFVTAKVGSSSASLQAAMTSPPLPKSSLSNFRSLRKRSFSEGYDDESSIPSKVFQSLRGSSKELCALRGRASSRKIGVVPPYTQMLGYRSPQGQASAGQETSSGFRSPGSKTTYKDSPRSSKINSKQELPSRSSARIRLVRKALEFT